MKLSCIMHLCAWIWPIAIASSGLLRLIPLFALSCMHVLPLPCRFKGLRMVAAPIVSFIDTITIGLRTTEESCPSDSSTAVITLSNFSHHVLPYNDR